MRIKGKPFDLKMKIQRFKKGYCDLDVWNINTFIEEKLVAILKEYRERHIGYPISIEQEEWDETIDRMIFLLTEMNEYTCSLNCDEINIKDYNKISRYRNKCKNEFYHLLKKWHWDLWD